MSVARRVIVAALGFLTSLFLASGAEAQQIEVLWLGHSAFRITSTTGKVIVIDPFLTTNPRTPAKYKDLAALGKVDLILVTHGHRDHLYDLSELAKLTGAQVIASYELSKTLVAAGLLDASGTIMRSEPPSPRIVDTAFRIVSSTASSRRCSNEDSVGK